VIKFLIYLDKDVLFRYAHARLFRERTTIASIEVVDAIITGYLEAFVSPDVVFAFYNHIQYKLRRPVDRGGMNLDWDEAIRCARDFTQQTFGLGSWNIVSLPINDLRIALQDTRFDFEDAVQFYSAKLANTTFITWNIRHFAGKGLEVKTPKTLIAEFQSIA
jgi:hypothetical protein